MNIIKIRDSPFSLFSWYQNQKGKPNFFGDRVSFRSLYSPSGTLRCCRCRRVTSPPPPSPQISLSPMNFFGQLFSGRKPQISRLMRPIYTSEETPPENSFPRAATCHSSPAACVPRACSCGRVAHFPVLG